MIIQRNPLADDSAGGILFYMPMQLVVPRAVTIAVAILAIICTMNFRVSFLLIMVNVQWSMFNDEWWGLRPNHQSPIGSWLPPPWLPPVF